MKLPAWAEKLRQGYLSGEASQFLLYSNVGDLVRWQEGTKLEFITMMDFITRLLIRTKEIVAFYNISDGLYFARKEMRDIFLHRMTMVRRVKGEAEWSGVIPSLPSKVMAMLGELVTSQPHGSAAVIEFLETLAPEGEMGYLSQDDRACIVAIQDWSRDPGLVTSDNIVVMVAENVMEVNKSIRSSPQLMLIEVGLPDREERLAFIKHAAQKYLLTGMSHEQLADQTAGLSRNQIESIFKHASESIDIVTMDGVARKRKEVIERECMGLVEVIDPRHGFDSVGGMDEIKKILEGVAASIRKGQKRRAPMGILLVGPMGTGKTFLAEAFAKESGLTCVKMKSFREKWVGSTEANLERILAIVQALGYVLVIIDEADRNLGSDKNDSDSGTESRVIARLKEFMSDGGHRGRIVFMILTNRPDKLDVDLKRPGRLDLKIPMFYPRLPRERVEILAVLAKKDGFAVRGVDINEVAERTEGFSGADLEGLLVTADRLAAEEGKDVIEKKEMEAALADFIPSRNQLNIEFMELLAAFEGSSKRLLPEKFRDYSAEELQERISELKMKLGL